MTKELINIIKAKAQEYGFDKAMLLSFVATETGGQGFDSVTGKITIQFEPAWFKKQAPYAPSGLWSLNEVERQAEEWKAFNDAFAKNPDAAMKSTSIGLGQIMGFHYALLGYKTVGEMWDDAKKGLVNQVDQICKFIANTPKLKVAIVSRNFSDIASIYNGAGFRELAKKLNRVPYDITLANNYKIYSNL